MSTTVPQLSESTSELHRLQTPRPRIKVAPRHGTETAIAGWEPRGPATIRLTFHNRSLGRLQNCRITSESGWVTTPAMIVPQSEAGIHISSGFAALVATCLWPRP